jgi:hypothetical protein
VPFKKSALAAVGIQKKSGRAVFNLARSFSLLYQFFYSKNGSVLCDGGGVSKAYQFGEQIIAADAIRLLLRRLLALAGKDD